MSLESTTIKITALEKEYEIVLNKYKEALNNYLSALNDEEYIELKGRTWWGTSALKEGEVSTSIDCQTMCKMDNKCSGATFNSVKKYCWTRSGDGNITVGDGNDIALIPKRMAALEVLKTLNKNLLELNQQIIDEYKNIKPEMLEQSDKMLEQELLLKKYYDNLLDQKQELNKQLNEYYSLEKNNEYQTLFVEQQNARYSIWSIIAIILLIITITYLSNTSSGLMISSLIIIIIVIILSYLLKTPSGFMISFLIILVALLWLR